ncbi:hypothetical protein [Natrialba asiatica]|uniref:PGF-CTERM sorting domain-containing protein n=1 Tax=Natrialba asiatica (strain ATCC 700177 / DSM 12278 / JCM 9576 / FERM P-10747 / NBRC 102637 / 172P1) TaxID=29540 RepID=M0ATY5_NATA1|nr:hypothetical protein [Natrialba asiatica]ELZ00839.1 hypothetical protein C481_11410 [Natrialba asiatica DSM 12278]
MSARVAPVLAVAVLLVCASIGGVAQQRGQTGVSSQVNAPPTDTYVVEQGDRCQQIEPLSTGETVESFYDYRNHETHSNDTDRMYSSYGTQDLQEDNTSLLFLHEGTDGLSLVTVNDRVDGDTTGGIATFEFVGVPHESAWAVQDDNYTGETNMAEWYGGDGWLGASLIWAEGRTDGGAINGGLNGPFSLTVQPAFNDDAEFADADELYDPDFHDGGEIEDWVVLSGDADDPDRATLPSLDEPVTIRTGTCDGPSVTYERHGNTSGPDTEGDGITATIDGASEGDTVYLQPTAGTTDGVRFDGIEATGLDTDSTIRFESNQPDGLPESPDDVQSLGHLSVTSDDELGEVSGTVTFSVDADLLNERGIEPDELALYERGGDGWAESETTVRDATGDSYEFSASVSSLGGFTVAPQQPSTITESPMPGFGPVVALSVIVALIGAAAIRTRRRE